MIDSQYIAESIEKAKNGYPRLLPIIKGGSSPKCRRLLNLIGARSTKYLEIGVAAGSTFIPAIYKNRHLQAVCIDDWRPHSINDFGAIDVRSKFIKNINRYVKNYDITIIEQDCFKTDLKLIGAGVDMYFYDGDHSRQSQYMALTYFGPVLANRFVLIVDDFNLDEPLEETCRAIRELVWEVEWYITLPTVKWFDPKDWWNGLFVAIINKREG